MISAELESAPQEKSAEALFLWPLKYATEVYFLLDNTLILFYTRKQ